MLGRITRGDHPERTYDITDAAGRRLRADELLLENSSKFSIDGAPYITHGLVKAHGGRITVESTPGVGSTFRVWLPAARS